MKDESTAGPSHYTWADYITISLLRPFYLATFLSSDRLPSEQLLPQIGLTHN